ncbi:esterase family protein [Gordonia amarae]|uniref:Esterase family protein n=2 Tax=Gordonia amarae TaxID=36821 RepID=A0A857LUT4_9ACTN|nr:alpha/beta hydrolase family protein [Gordonia amarae]MCS3879451.1 S-formylglutathione hydrolase FrmB [Gordonia amarae]QHN17919.1 esterase family protein [Gordonia amarae]QHN22441.1 esterase family protein [Gordonia amarae]QHN31317.1 esterase family protein [Gordonia amarae]QHN40062.1 esterase family protein [Gordonia amarae]
MLPVAWFPSRAVRLSVAVVLGALIALLTATSFVIPAAGADPRTDGQLHSLRHLRDNLWEATAYSTAMDTEIPLHIIRPAGGGAGAPTFYLLNGAGGGEDGANWLAQTDAMKFFADKNVNVVIPEKGIGSYYTDWIARDPAIGKPMWQTFLTTELPRAVNTSLRTNGVNAIGGMSMSATSVLNLAIVAPTLYKGVASYSGCARTSTLEGYSVIRGTVYVANKANVDNMWGPFGSPLWTTYDPYVNAARLRGLTLYLSSGNGMAGKYDKPGLQAPGAPTLGEQVVVGGALEAAAHTCTTAMAGRLRQLRIPATVHLSRKGTHSWGYWQDELHRSWPTIATSLRR